MHGAAGRMRGVAGGMHGVADWTHRVAGGWVGRRPRCTALRSTPAVALRARVRKTAPDSRSALATAAYLRGEQGGAAACGGGGDPWCEKTAAQRPRQIRPPARPAGVRSSSGRPPAAARLHVSTQAAHGSPSLAAW
eukprot:scaffold109698_cov60-Phaeocystis_antarctica.AAC.3